MQAVLDELRNQGLTFIYSSETVPSTLRVVAEPKAREGLELAREILARYSLTLTEVAPRVYSVTGTPRIPVRPTSPSASASLEEVVVQSSRYVVAGDSATSHAFFSQDEIRNLPRLADETLRTVQRLPGAASNGFSSLSYVRGGEANETAVELDGLRLHEPFHLRDFLSPVSLLDARWIQGIDFYSGGFPTSYGDRMSAILDAHSLRPTKSRYYEAGLTLFHTNALAASDLWDGQGDVLLSGRRSNADFLSELSENDFGEPSYYDAFGRLQYRWNEDTRGAIEALIAGDNVRARRDGGRETARVADRNTYVWGTLDHDWSSRAATRVVASYTEVSDERHGEINDPGRRIASVSDRRLTRIGEVKVDGSWEFAPNEDDHALSLRYGAGLQDLQAEYLYGLRREFSPGYPFPQSVSVPLVRDVELQPNGYAMSGHLDTRLPLSNRWVAQVGLRFDHETYTKTDGSGRWSPRASLLYRLSERTDVRASWGRYFQSQGIDELQVEDNVTRFFEAAHADHLILSLSHTFGVGEWRIEAYRKDYRELKPRFENLFNPLRLLPETEFDRVRVDPDTARSEGAELLLRLAPESAWSGWLSYAWSRVRDRIEDRSELRSWDQTHAVNVGVTWARGPWLVTLADHFHTGWPTTELVVGPSGPAGVPDVRFGPRNTQRFDNYNSVDLRVARTFAIKHGALETFVEVTNVLSESNDCCVNYSVTLDANGAVSLSKDIDHWLPLVPSAGILWRY